MQKLLMINLLIFLASSHIGYAAQWTIPAALQNAAVDNLVAPTQKFVVNGLKAALEVGLGQMGYQHYSKTQSLPGDIEIKQKDSFSETSSQYSEELNSDEDICCLDEKGDEEEHIGSMVHAFRDQRSKRELRQNPVNLQYQMNRTLAALLTVKSKARFQTQKQLSFIIKAAETIAEQKDKICFFEKQIALTYIEKQANILDTRLDHAALKEEIAETRRTSEINLARLHKEKLIREAEDQFKLSEEIAHQKYEQIMNNSRKKNATVAENLMFLQKSAESTQDLSIEQNYQDLMSYITFLKNRRSSAEIAPATGDQELATLETIQTNTKTRSKRK